MGPHLSLGEIHRGLSERLEENTQKKTADLLYMVLLKLPYIGGKKKKTFSDIQILYHYHIFLP